MSKTYRILIFVIAIAALIGFFYWQKNKDVIIGNRIDTVVTKKSNNLYAIKYDSSFIDELNGNAFFYNVSLSADTNLAESQLSKNTYKVHIGEVAIKGANVIGLLTGNTLQAHSIQFIHPVFEIVKQNKEAQTYTKEDTLALYEQILGKYKSIKADLVSIDKGQVNISDKINNSSTSVKDINIRLADFKIDSTKDYKNLVSYFITGLDAHVGEVALIKASNDKFLFSNVNFNAASKLMSINNVQQMHGNKMITDFKNVSLNGLETGVFIRQQIIEADELHTDGGVFTLYRKKGKGRNTFETDNSVFDKAKIRKVSIGKTKVLVINRDKPTQPPLVLNNIQLTATDLPVIEENGSLNKVIANSNWIISGDGLETQSKNREYGISIGAFVIDKYKQSAQVEKFIIKPTMTEAMFVKTRKVQEDYVELEFKKVSFTKVNLQDALSLQSLSAAEIKLRPTIKIFNDRTLPRNLKSKIPTDPAELIKNLGYPIKFDKIIIDNGYLSYRERGMISAKIGMLFFDNLNAVISNVTNIPSAYNSKPDMVLQANAKFIGKSKFVTTWHLPLNKSNGPFTMSGKLDAIEGRFLNVALEPQAMISVKQGEINSFIFQSQGNNSQAHTVSTLLYNGLKLNLLKKDKEEKELQKKTALSFLANIFISDRNPDNGKVRKNVVDYNRDSSRSFFYLVSQSFFLSIRKSITGKNNAK